MDRLGRIEEKNKTLGTERCEKIDNLQFKTNNDDNNSCYYCCYKIYCLLPEPWNSAF